MPTKTTKVLMRKIVRRMDHLIDLECCHCGHEELVDKAIRYRAKLLCFLEDELDALTPDDMPKDL